MVILFYSNLCTVWSIVSRILHFKPDIICYEPNAVSVYQNLKSFEHSSFKLIFEENLFFLLTSESA